jgi:xylose isomerase
MLNYPEHFDKITFDQILAALRETPLSLGGINLRYPEGEFGAGAFTLPDEARRRAAVQLTCQAADLCRQAGARHLVIWLSSDGFDYPFQMDFARAWDRLIESLKAITDYAPELKISIEYKPADPRRFSLVGDVSTTLLAIQECRAPNLGVTLDFCHQLMAGENPAMSAALCLRQKRLYGLHLNDGYRTLDDGLMVGSVHLAETVELLYHIVHSDFSEFIYFDTFPAREDPVQECAANIQRCEQIADLIHRMDQAGLPDAIAAQHGLKVAQIFWNGVFQR